MRISDWSTDMCSSDRGTCRASERWSGTGRGVACSVTRGGSVPAGERASPRGWAAARDRILELLVMALQPLRSPPQGRWPTPVAPLGATSYPWLPERMTRTPWPAGEGWRQNNTAGLVQDLQRQAQGGTGRDPHEGAPTQTTK